MRSDEMKAQQYCEQDFRAGYLRGKRNAFAASPLVPPSVSGSSYSLGYWCGFRLFQKMLNDAA